MCDGCKIQYVGTGETCYYCANRPKPAKPTPQDKPEDKNKAGATR